MTGLRQHVGDMLRMIGAPLMRMLRSRWRISTQFYLAIGSAVALTLVASLVGWISFDRVADIQSRVVDDSIPTLAGAFGVAQQGGTLVAAATNLTAAATPAELERVANKVAEDRKVFDTQLSVLARQGENTRSDRIAARGVALTQNIAEVEDVAWEIFAAADLQEKLRDDLALLRRRLNNVLIPAIDDQLFYTVTGYRQLGEPPDPRVRHFSTVEFERYRTLAQLQADAAIEFQTLATVFSVTDYSLLEPLRERLEAVARGIRRRVASLPAGPLQEQLENSFSELIDLGIGVGGGLDLRERALGLQRQERELLSRNRTLAVDLVTEAAGLVNVAREGAREATVVSAKAIGTGRNLLLGLSVVSVLGAGLVGWLFVGKTLVPRLAYLSERMRRMARGDLEEKVVLSGADEVAEMAAALEVFRRHALEVQRLNLVEKLAEELRGKNLELEAAMGDLTRAQDQIVMGQKLAALGELAAGVAHEIRNPLNFVKNFSEASEELLADILEEIAVLAGKDGKEEGEDDRLGLIREIGADLTANLRRIQKHGTRADRIVQSMLMMGRGTTDRYSADINQLVEEHARLAYHSARATDLDFQMELIQELDPAVGELEVIPQDLGRLFLNMVSNACYATDEKRRRHSSAGGANGRGNGSERYAPTLWITSRSVENAIEVRFRDNGNGIPAEIVDKIFDPFFTTKPTDKGTGLGLSLCNDIARAHGGSIKVESEPGEFTEMIITLPRRPPAEAVANDMTEGED